MTLLCDSEHKTCQNSQTPDPSSIVEVLNLPKGTKIDRLMTEAEIIFVLKGRFLFSYGEVHNKEIHEGSIILLPPGDDIKTFIREDAVVLVIRIKSSMHLSDIYTLGSLYRHKNLDGADVNILPFNQQMIHYLDSFVPILNDGIPCRNFIDLKIQELFIILNLYYPQRELAIFFKPLLTADAAFSDFIWRNYRDVKTVNDLAQMANTSISTFKTKFKNNFGMAPRQWINMQKAKNIYHDLITTDKLLKEISEKYHFASVSHFCYFCRQKFDATPGEIREKKYLNT